jgi:phage terminase large subunit
MTKRERLIERAYELASQYEKEKVSQKLEILREPAPYKCVHGGRSGSKTWGICSIFVQILQHECKRLLCTREIQLTLADSVYQIFVDTINRLGYSGWHFKKDIIEHDNGSKILFRGLRDVRAATGIKGLEGLDYVWIEEAQSVSEESLRILLPTIRKEGSEVWASWNPESEDDPINSLLYRPGCIEIEINWYDNKWLSKRSKQDIETDFKTNPDMAEHVWNGKPLKQGANCIFSRVLIREATKRIVDPVGAVELGVDVARFGDDDTTVWRRKGMLVQNYNSVHGYDTVLVCDLIEDIAGHDKSLKIKIDEGYNPGVIDVLKHRGYYNVIPVSFGANASDPDRYPNIASELWLTFNMSEVQIPDDRDLINQLADRRYKFDGRGRRMVESKADYKTRHGGKSPDLADGLLLCYYDGLNCSFGEDISKAMEELRNAGY